MKPRRPTHSLAGAFAIGATVAAFAVVVALIAARPAHPHEARPSAASSFDPQTFERKPL